MLLQELVVTNSSDFNTSADYLRRTLCHEARTSNRLAKNLIGRNRAEAYKAKVRALNALIEGGWARANSISSDGVVVLDIDDDRPTCLHIQSIFLSVQARAKVYSEARSTRRDFPAEDLMGFNDGE